MENASKAIIIAGGMLIAIGLMSLFLLFFNSFRQYNSNKEDLRESEEVANFNRYFTYSNYDVDKNMAGTQIYGHDVYNLALKACELSRSYEGYVIKVVLGSTDLETENGNIEAVKTKLGTCGLYYDALQYADYYATPEQAQAAADARSAYINNFNKTFTLTELHYSDADGGRINYIKIN